MNINECLEKGYLTKIEPDKELIKKEIEESEYDFEKAKKTFDDKDYKWSIIKSYYAMFHVARALLFKLGLKEKRHFAISVVLDELNNNIPDLVKYTKLSSSKVKSIIGVLKEYMSIIPSSEYKEFESKVKQLSPHRSDKDIPYFALALKLDCAIWSNEPSFKQQSKVEILNTKELKEILNFSESSLT